MLQKQPEWPVRFCWFFLKDLTGTLKETLKMTDRRDSWVSPDMSLDNLPCVFLHMHHCGASPFKQNGEDLARTIRNISLSPELTTSAHSSVQPHLYPHMPGRVSWLNLISLQPFCHLKPFINHISFKKTFICILWRAIIMNLEIKTRTNANPV